MCTVADRVHRGGRELTERTLGLARTGADRLAQLLHARHDSVADRLSAHLDLRGDRLNAADQELLEAVDPRIERRGNLERARAEAGVDLVRPGVERVRKRSTARVDGAARLVDTLLERADDILAAVGKRSRDLRHTRTERLIERVDAPIERIAQPRDPLVHAGRSFGGARAHPGVEVVDMGTHRLGDFHGAVAQPLDQLAAVDLHGAVELAEVLRDQVPERLRVARDLVGKLGAAMGEHVLERL